MKKIVATFIIYFVTHVAVSLLLRENEDIVRILISALVSDVIFHILFYFVLSRFGKKTKEKAEN